MSDDNYSDILDINQSSVWDGIHADIRKNVDFLSGKKRSYLNKYIADKFTSNYDLLPRLEFPITSFFVTMLSTFYNSSTMFVGVEGESLSKHINIFKLKLVLRDFQQHRFLNLASFIRLVTGGEKTDFELVIGYDIIYDYYFENVCLRLKQRSDNLSEFEYYKKIGNKFGRVTFVAKDFGSFPYDKMFEFDDEQKRTFQISEVTYYDVLPIIPLFSNIDRYSYPSIYASFDEIFTTLLSFGLAGAPMSLFVKIFIKNNDLNNNSQKYKAFGDLLAILELGERDDVGKVDTGDLTSLKNFFTIFEASLAWLARMVGISTNAVSSQTNEVRKSGSSKYVDNGPASIFRSSYIVEFDEFEYRLFEAIKKLNNNLSDFEFKPIDKTNDRLMTDEGTFVDNLINEVRGMMTPYEEAIAKKYNVDKSKAKEIAVEIQKQFEKYFPKGYDSNESVEGSTTPFNLKKGYLNGNNAQNITEDD